MSYVDTEELAGILLGLNVDYALDMYDQAHMRRLTSFSLFIGGGNERLFRIHNCRLIKFTLVCVGDAGT